MEWIKEAHRRIMVAKHPDSGEKCDQSDRGYTGASWWPTTLTRVRSVIKVTQGGAPAQHSGPPPPTRVASVTKSDQRGHPRDAYNLDLEVEVSSPS